MTDAKDQISEILRKAYQIEVNGYTFYSMAADRAEKPAVQELFDKLAKDEVQHQAYLRDIMKGYDEKGVTAFQADRRRPDMQAFTQSIFTDSFKEQAAGAAFEMGVLSIGMQLESNAIAYFTEASRKADDKEVKDFYRFLADWEQEHYEALQALFGGVRQDFWSDGGFSPF